MKIPLETKASDGTRYTVLGFSSNETYAICVKHSNLKIELVGISKLTALSEKEYESFKANKQDTTLDDDHHDMMNEPRISQSLSKEYLVTRASKLVASTNSLCSYCNQPIKPGQPTIPEEWGEFGARMHIGCAAEDQDGQDIDRNMGDS